MTMKIYQAAANDPRRVVLVASRETWEAVVERIPRADVELGRTIRRALVGIDPGGVVRLTLTPAQARVVMGGE